MLLTCNHLAEITKTKSLWANLLKRQRGLVPLPPDTRKNVDGWSAAALERLVSSNELVEALWLIPRQSAPVKLEERRGELLIGLEIILDRWILSVYADGYINLWDDEDSSLKKQCSFAYTGKDKISSYQAALDDSGEKLMVVVTNVYMPGDWKAILYEVQLSDPELQFVHVYTIPTTSSRIARQLCPAERIVAFSQLSSINIVRWPENYEGTPTSASIVKPFQFDELEEMFTTVLALRCLDKCIFVFKTRSIELYPMPDSDADPQPTLSPSTLRHSFPSYNFREVRISDVEAEQCPAESYNRYTLALLASDVIQGLFHFTVNITVPYESFEQSLLEVHLTAIHAMVNNIPLHGHPGAGPGSTLTTRLWFSNSSESAHPNPSESSAPSSSSATPTPRSTSTMDELHPSPNFLRRLHDSHGVSTSGRLTSSFVAAYAMGSQGMRAIWVERRRGDTMRRIVSCQLQPKHLLTPLSSSSSASASGSRSGTEGNGGSNPDENGIESGLEALPWAIDGHVIYSIQSYDLREDITSCALGEVSGKIVLGNRAGDVFVLDTGA
ncbi:hypothetical protein D9757_007456 [Collybiopsis confluens]|uniref:Uncharacterized protein n=1 Tax=Collybiopsis confluens TaxID=2823264 RepID=A0A8H5HJQ4_9AGAR|nr:hypothetical protein D9757_007456 [Collybiopsis confluens]